MTARDADLPEVKDDRTARRARPSRRKIVLLVLAGLLAVALIVVWLARKPIATSYIDSYFASRGVPVQYRIVDLGLRRQRLADVVIGDPQRPDLVADWIEMGTRLELAGARVTAVRIGRVRANGRIVAGRLSLGALDRLLPSRGGGPFTLPKLAVDLGDARFRLATPQGDVALRLQGRGRLDDGFEGQVAAVSAQVSVSGCSADTLRLVSAIRIAAGKPRLTGWARAANASCGGAVLSGLAADFDATVAAPLDRWTGAATVALDAVHHPLGTLAVVRGKVTFDGTAAATAGAVDLNSRQFAARAVSAAMLRFNGRYRLAGGVPSLAGKAVAREARLPASMLGQMERAAAPGTATPVEPLIRQFVAAATAVGRRFDVDADVAFAPSAVEITRLVLSSASGARAVFAGHAKLRIDHFPLAPSLDGMLTVNGGKLPSLRAQIAQTVNGAVNGTAIVQPYSAGAARLALTPVKFSFGAAGGSVNTRIALTGPIGNGAVTALEVPLSATWDGRSTIAVNPNCTPVTFVRLAVSGLVLRPGMLQLCPLSGALLRWDQTGIAGGGRLAATALAGTLGTSRITLATGGATFDLATLRFAARDLAVRIGSPDRVTQLDIATLDGGAAGTTVGGHFGGGAAQIGAVPLLLSSADGTWTFAGGKIDLAGALVVRDSAATPRFEPLAAKSVALTVAGNRIRATGTLVAPASGVSVAAVTVVHDLGSAVGSADLDVAGVVFGPTLQPNALTPLTFGVIADLAGTISGEGHIRWNAQGVTSDGVFRTKDASLAAAFGPVTGLTSEIRFTNLLNLESAPGQIATVATINPGVPVTDGMIRYQLLSGARVKIEAARWPFAGGSLALDPTTLDFGQPIERMLTFRVGHVDAAKFLQQFGFSNLDASGVFDGTLPMLFGADGGRIENGQLSAQPGGGTIAYVGEVSQKDLGFWGNFAFQSLKSLRYRQLDIAMNGPLAGDMVTEVRFAGVGQGRGAKRNFLFDRLQKLPLVFNVRIKAPFRQLIDAAQSFYDPRRLIERNLPALLEEQNKRDAAPTIQPPASRTMP